MSFLITVSPLKEASQVAYSPVAGRIRQVTVSWPNGCNFLVEALVRKGKLQFYPAGDVLGNGLPVGIALNDHTLTTAMNQPIAEDDILEVVAINHDAANLHQISAVLLIEGEEQKMEVA